jgi:hypothetical protein
LISSATKSGTSGVLWATGVFIADQPLNLGQTLSITYQTSLT